MAVNKIHRIYGQTKWRPTHYVKVDFSAFDPDDWYAEILQHVRNGEQCLLWDAFRAGADPYDGNFEYIFYGIGDFSNVRYIPRCGHHYLLQGAWHHICTGLNSILTMVVWAVELGYTEIVLVGCDGKFTTPAEDHFDPGYYKAIDGEYAKRNNDCVRRAHEVIAADCPVRIYDATVNGSLDFYPKVRLEEIVKEEKIYRGAQNDPGPARRDQDRKEKTFLRQANGALD